MPLREAPGRTDCVTAVFYLFLTVCREEMPLDWIGNLPRLLATHRWSVLTLDREELQPGDLLFLKNRASRREITHVAVALAANRVFHSAWKINGRMETVDQLFARYAQPGDADALLNYCDERGVMAQPTGTT